MTKDFREQKKKLIQKIEKSRKSKLIAYITGDRQHFSTKIADDIIPILSNHLEKIGKQKIISLFLYTRGGDMIAPIRIIKLIRNFAEKIEIIIPYRAHSAGTLLAIGADTIVMGKLAELSPVDPSTGHRYNPQDPINPLQRMEISVEDLNSFFLLAKEKAGVKDQDMVEIYKLLAEKIHPLAIGNVYRAARMARQIVEKLLLMHNNGLDKNKREKIIKELTGDICIHNYPITRDEAKELGLNIDIPDIITEKDIWNLYECYSEEMELLIPFNPLEILKNKQVEKFELTAAFIESEKIINNFLFKGEVKLVNGLPSINILSSIWN